MKLFVLLLFIQSISGEYDFLSDEALHQLNEMKYSQESIVYAEEAEFHFIIFDTNYSRNVLGIDSYYFSITFIDEEPREVRLEKETIPNNTMEYRGLLKMENLEEGGNYLVCVFFLNQTNLIGSSRFCYVVSVGNKCQLEISEGTFDAIYLYILLGFVGVLLIIIVVFSRIRGYVYRPRTIEDYLKVFPEHHRVRLEDLAPTADERRRRRTQPALDKRLREDSVHVINYDPNTDHDYHNYHGIDNASLDTLTE